MMEQTEACYRLMRNIKVEKATYEGKKLHLRNEKLKLKHLQSETE